ncbi:MAG: hypothetical protein QM270_08725 [Bacillota bacterium]|nr:hypothetical protein [Bacillota bacterium]
MKSRAVTLAPAKINLYLRLGSVRLDGYHNLDTVMQTIALADWIALEHYQDPDVPASHRLLFETDGCRVAMSVALPDLDPASAQAAAAAICDPGRGTVPRAVRAWLQAGRRQQGCLPWAGGTLLISLEKRIPVEAGLGGASTDAAAALRLLQALFPDAALAGNTLLRLAAAIGADVPFCLTGGLARCRGIGEQIHSLPPLPNLAVDLVKPRLGISTARAFAHYRAAGPGWEERRSGPDAAARETFLTALADLSHARYRAVLREADLVSCLARLRAAGGNDFESLLAVDAPWMADWLAWLRSRPSNSYTGLSGSGSTVFTLRPDGGAPLDAAAWFREHRPDEHPQLFTTRLLDRLPAILFD